MFSSIFYVKFNGFVVPDSAFLNLFLHYYYEFFKLLKLLGGGGGGGGAKRWGATAPLPPPPPPPPPRIDASGVWIVALF